jgi:hypothetical protein
VLQAVMLILDADTKDTADTADTNSHTLQTLVV